MSATALTSCRRARSPRRRRRRSRHPVPAVVWQRPATGARRLQQHLGGQHLGCRHGPLLQLRLPAPACRAATAAPPHGAHHLLLGPCHRRSSGQAGLQLNTPRGAKPRCWRASPMLPRPLGPLSSAPPQPQKALRAPRLLQAARCRIPSLWRDPFLTPLPARVAHTAVLLQRSGSAACPSAPRSRMSSPSLRSTTSLTASPTGQRL
mmetsp:Transcript_98940/g.307754  ORF Transcript_98940/g.307754 Transcript_98940/m.307754 type:complete len:206 (-) Transcript_98940:690-1307(-)